VKEFTPNGGRLMLKPLNKWERFPAKDTSMHAISLTVFSAPTDLPPSLRRPDPISLNYESEQPEGENADPHAVIDCMEIAFTGLVITSVLLLAAGILNGIVPPSHIRTACINGVGLLAMFTGPGTALAVIIGLFNGRRGGGEIK